MCAWLCVVLVCYAYDSYLPQLSGASLLKSTASHLLQLLEHIHGSHEVAFLASSSEICIKTFRKEEQTAGGAALSADAPGSARLSTEMNVSATEFTDGYVFAGRDTEVS